MSAALSVDLSAVIVAPDVLRLVPVESMRRLGVLPLELKNGRMVVAMLFPEDLSSRDAVQLLVGHELDIVHAEREALAAALKRSLAACSERPFCSELDQIPANDAHAVDSVTRLFDLALSRRASDIHLEPQRQGFFVRLRIDGVLTTVHEYPVSARPPITSRIKVLAGMDISEKRLPQDGQIAMRADGADLDLRVSTMPGKYGEKIVIRLLRRTGGLVGLDGLGLDPFVQSTFEPMIMKPHGLILVTGPTGSGKTTTLYAVLTRLKSPMKNIVTLEDPVEYELLAENQNEMGVTQVQVRPKIGLTFAAGLRASLRQDPDVIMVGEIRDRETAETAMQAAMTGHVVFSTLHTNDAPGSIGRLVDMGVEPFLIASTVTGVLAQRLVRLLCEHCKETYQPPLRALKKLFPERPDLDRATFHRPRGCARCQGTGYWGRKGIFELMVVSEEIKQKIHSRSSPGELAELARAQGMKSLRDGGMDLVFAGLTTVEEVTRVTVE